MTDKPEVPSYTTRIAPSPTGMFHLGTARTAYFNWLAARASGGKFILRIDDTDTERNLPAAVDVILDSMTWLNLDYDQVYRQSERIPFYTAIASLMVDRGSAIRLDDGAVVLLVPPDLPEFFTDTIAGNIRITQTNRDQIAKTILLRSRDKDNAPTYQFCSVVDDYVMGVNRIIRGHDHITNTPKQIAIWQAMNGITVGVSSDKGSLRLAVPLPTFTHVGLIFKDGKKLSKRDDAASLLSYRDQGYHPDTILSFLLRMGWAPRQDDKTMKIISRERAIDLFLTHGAMRSSPAGFDQARLDMIQANYERMLNIPRDQWVRNQKPRDVDETINKENRP